MNDKELKQADCVVVSTTGATAVATGAVPAIPAKMAVAALGGKGAAVTLATKSALVAGGLTAVAPVVFVGAAAYGLWRMFK